ncbi:MAG: hypothetical protein PUB07_07905 [Clostridia bacterium]|nr:hypothetical protein [Clostridia bacterium]
MTLVEFFDDIAIHNAFSSLLFHPDRLILVGKDKRKMDAFRLRLQSVFLLRGLRTKIEILVINSKNYQEVLHQFEKLLQVYTDCYFDITDGEESMLVAVGALSAKHTIPMHTVHPIHGSFSPINGFSYPTAHSIQLRISELIALYGGKMTESFAPNPQDNFTRQACMDAWDICKQNCSAWNSAISTIRAARAFEDDLNISIRKSAISSATNRSNMQKFLDSLAAKKLIENYRSTNLTISFSYPNEIIRHMLTKEGSVLELYTYYAAYGNTYTAPFDIKTGVVIDWQTNHTPDHKDDVLNEIDVLLTENAAPVFISCKNGMTDTNELYKLFVVAERFGGMYAKKMIVLTHFKPDAAFKERARSLGIAVLENVHRLSFDTFQKTLTDFIH